MADVIRGSVRYAPIHYSTKEYGWCGKAFECSTQTRYRRRIAKKDIVFCSYGCIQAFDEQCSADDVKKINDANAKSIAAKKNWEKRREAAAAKEKKRAEKIRNAEEKYALYLSRVEASEPGTRERHSAIKMLSKWRIKLKELKSTAEKYGR